MSETATQDQDDIKKVARKYLGEFISPTKLESLTDTTPLITGGILDSITIVELAASLEDHYGIQFQTFEMSVEYFDTVGDIANVVQTKLAEK
jgi:acyl carrier protein